jgi:hypothetical protein
MLRLVVMTTFACGLLVLLPNAEVAAQGDPKASKPGSFNDRSGANRAKAVEERGGNKESEEAVERGLKWLVRMQHPDGRWKLNDPNLPEKERSPESNDVAATAFGLLPFLAAGHTHKAAKANPYDKVVDKGLRFLMRSQDQKTGYMGTSMYTHGLAAIALCEAYGMTKDPALKKSAQATINLIVNVQHDGGGWRYSPTKNMGDTSIGAWQISALVTAQAAGLDVPKVTIKKATAFLDSVCDMDEGYRYLSTGSGSSTRLTAVGLLGRQYLQNWGPEEPRYVKAMEKFLKANPPGKQDVYYTYYATQVMYHAGGENWTAWNEKMRDFLIKKQVANNKSPMYGSWSTAGDPWGRQGGCLMMTSLSLLTLEIYYRHTPLFAKAKD